MEIKIEKLNNLVERSGDIFIEPEAEKVLIELLDLQEQIEKAIDTAEEILEKKALELNPNFSSLKSDNLKVYYRQYGPRYRLDESVLDQIPEDLYKKVVKYNPVAKAIDEWTREHDGMPIGIQEKTLEERPKSLKFSKREKATHEV